MFGSLWVSSVQRKCLQSMAVANGWGEICVASDVSVTHHVIVTPFASTTGLRCLTSVL